MAFNFLKLAAFVSVSSLLSAMTLAAVTPTGAAAQAAPTILPTTSTGRLPALGWNSWNAYRCDINESRLMAAANQFVSLGLKDAGYEYVNIDDCWAEMSRDSSGRMIPSYSKFPNGIKSVADKIHALGLKIGIYRQVDAGTNTCAGYPGSLGREDIDAATFSSWGIDYLKYDNCYVPGNWSDASSYSDWYNSNSAVRYRQMTAALSTQSRPIHYSLCIWGTAHVWDWGARVGHSWRMSGDSSPTWNYIISIIQTNVAHINTIGFYAHNDMDMMEIGNGQLTLQEQRTHFAVWAFMKSPILLGTDLSKLSSTQLAIIKNRELLAFHQDSGVSAPAKPFTAYSGMPSTNPPEYYTGTSGQGIHVFIINTSSSTANKQFAFSSVPNLGSGNFRLHDMWTGSDLSGTYTASSTFTVSVAAHDTVAYLIKRV